MAPPLPGAILATGIDGNMRPGLCRYLLGRHGPGSDLTSSSTSGVLLLRARARASRTRHEACAAAASRMPLPAMLRPGEPKFEDCLAGCVRVHAATTAAVAPHWHAYWVDGDPGNRRRRGGRED
ncbi:hypothetical protein ZWY2020_048094 [Hordeum vulgare]|nr:hypothetical protein ZWY2020_048094 [Hordeum vulgare]